MPGRIIDISSNNHPNGSAINWAQVKDAGVTTAIIKATEGTGYVNPFYQYDVVAAENNGIDTMAYHFAGFGSPNQEVQFFKSVAGTKARCLDIETSTNIGWVRSFLTTLGLPPGECLTYGSASSLGQIRNTIPSLTWPAAYGQNYPGWGVMWQFTSTAKVDGIVGNVDESRWYGSEGQYEALFKAPKPSPEEDMKPYYVTNSQGTGFVVAADLSSKVGIVDGADAQTLLGTGQYEVLKLSDAQINAIPNPS